MAISCVVHVLWVVGSSLPSAYLLLDVCGLHGRPVHAARRQQEALAPCQRRQQLWHAGILQIRGVRPDNINAMLAWSQAGFAITMPEVTLPVGISFFVFQSMSYTIDYYRGQVEPARNFFQYTTFVSFFPQLVAGPIERASNLLPQAFRKIHHHPAKYFGRTLAICGRNVQKGGNGRLSCAVRR